MKLESRERSRISSFLATQGPMKTVMASGSLAFTMRETAHIGETVVDTGREDLPTAVLIGESYTNALETLLYASFDELHTIDPRSFAGASGGADIIGDITAYIEALQPDVVIVMRDNSAYLKAVGG